MRVAVFCCIPIVGWFACVTDPEGPKAEFDIPDLGVLRRGSTTEISGTIKLENISDSIFVVLSHLDSCTGFAFSPPPGILRIYQPYSDTALVDTMGFSRAQLDTLDNPFREVYSKFTIQVAGVRDNTITYGEDLWMKLVVEKEASVGDYRIDFSVTAGTFESEYHNVYFSVR